MKRDVDLVRDIRLMAESIPAGPPMFHGVGEVEDLVLRRHLEMVIEASSLL